MTSALPDPLHQSDQSTPPRQYWLDVARPIQTRLPHDRPALLRPQRRADDAHAGRQMELRMVAPAPPAAPTPIVAPLIVLKAQPRPDVMMQTPTPVTPPPLTFVKWLIAQNRSGGAIGDLAKAARLDPLFPKDGSADAVRARFSKAGADGDAFAALDDAELAYDRLA
jgi:hypothetical protein